MKHEALQTSLGWVVRVTMGGVVTDYPATKNADGSFTFAGGLTFHP